MTNKRTKIVATISEKTGTPEMLKKMIEVGVNVIRLNTAHQALETSKGLVEIIRKIDNGVAILIDTKGPEVRTSSFGDSMTVVAGDQIKIMGNSNGASGNGILYVNYDHFTHDVNKGDHVLIDDGEISMVVMGKDKDSLLCKIENSGTIKPRKGVNVPNVKLNLPVISSKDKDFIEFAIQNKLDFIAHSFVQHADDIKQIRAILHKRSNLKIIAKIENQTGVDNIDEIIEEADGIMVARGDLGIEIPAEQIPVIQRELVSKCLEHNKTVIIATQMLHSMINNPRPTRAEVNDVATAVYEQADALMLSGETANGSYPIEAVTIMAKVIHEVEKAMAEHVVISDPLHDDVLSVLAHSAVFACNNLPVKAIIVDTVSGRTANFLSGYRGKVPIFAFCYNEYSMRQLALTYGVKSFISEPNNSRDKFIHTTVLLLIQQKIIECEDMVVVVGGSFGKENGASFMEISTVQKLIERGKEIQKD